MKVKNSLIESTATGLELGSRCYRILGFPWPFFLSEELAADTTQGEGQDTFGRWGEVWVVTCHP
jgi:hypothetical protein